MGAAYEIGALTALDRLFCPGFSTRRFDIYVGISAGSIIAALVANRISPAGLFEAIINEERSVFNWGRSDIYRLDAREMFSSFGSALRNLYRIFRNYRRNRWKTSFTDFLHILQEQFPAGFFSLEPMQKYLCRSFRREGLADEFDRLPAELYIPAYDLDNGERVVFGSEGHRGLHICRAITASCAIPYFFRPYRLGGRHFLDGSIGQMAHLDIAVERGAKLIVVINPRVPVRNDVERFCLPSLSYGRCSSIAELGITFAWEQAQRIENQVKLEMTLEVYRHSHPDVDIVVIEPGSEESLLFFQNPMSHSARNHIMTYGRQLTLGQLQRRFEELRDIFSRHGIRLRSDRLDDPLPADMVRSAQGT